MNLLLFQVQQFFVPVFAFWPIWFFFVAIWIVLKRVFPQAHVVRNWSKIAIFWSIILIAIIRVVYFVIQPYQEQFFESQEKSYSTRIYVRNGKLTVKSKQGTEKWLIDSYSPKSMNKFVVEEYSNTELNTTTTETVLHFNESLAMNVLSKRWHNEDMLIPADYEKQLYVVIQDGIAEIDLSESNVTDFKLKGFESEVVLKIPINQKSYKLSLVGVKAPLKLVISRNSYISVTETYATFYVTPEGFVQDSRYKWHKDGNNGQKVDIELGLGRNGLALEYVD